MSKIDLTTPAKRRALPSRKEAYFMPVAGPRGGVSLGWRPGVWIAKNTIGVRGEGKIGIADDAGFDGIDFKTATQLAIDWAKLKQAEDTTTGPLTVRSAIEAYIAAKNDKDVTSRLTSRVLSDRAFCEIKLRALTAVDIQKWRQGLAGLKSSSINRYMNPTRAALNAAAELHSRALPADLPAQIKLGFKKVPMSGAEAAREIPHLSDEVIRRLIDAAYGLNDDFGHLVLLNAVTGMRHSQLTRVKVSDLMFDAVIVPGSRKGRGGKEKPAIRVSLTHGVYERLRKATLDENGQPRPGDEPLLMRWHHAHDMGKVGTKWVKSHRRPWGAANEVSTEWQAACLIAGVPGTIMYALRHSSIKRHILKGMPISMVAELHDTSTAMIQATYGRDTSKAADQAMRRLGALSLVA